MDKPKTTAVAETQFVTGVRLNVRQWALALGLILLVVFSDAPALEAHRTLRYRPGLSHSL
jgi:hypothetical protein